MLKLLLLLLILQYCHGGPVFIRKRRDLRNKAIFPPTRDQIDNIRHHINQQRRISSPSISRTLVPPNLESEQFHNTNRIFSKNEEKYSNIKCQSDGHEITSLSHILVSPELKSEQFHNNGISVHENIRVQNIHQGSNSIPSVSRTLTPPEFGYEQSINLSDGDVSKSFNVLKEDSNDKKGHLFEFRKTVLSDHSDTPRVPHIHSQGVSEISEGKQDSLSKVFENNNGKIESYNVPFQKFRNSFTKFYILPAKVLHISRATDGLSFHEMSDSKKKSEKQHLSGESSLTSNTTEQFNFRHLEQSPGFKSELRTNEFKPSQFPGSDNFESEATKSELKQSLLHAFSNHKTLLEKPSGLYDLPDPSGKPEQISGISQFSVSGGEVEQSQPHDFSVPAKSVNDFTYGITSSDVKTSSPHHFSVHELKPGQNFKFGINESILKPSDTQAFSKPDPNSSERFDFAITASKFKPSQPQEFSVHKAGIEKPSGLYEIPVPNGEQNQPLGRLQSQSKLEPSQPHGFSSHKTEHSEGFGISNSNIGSDGQLGFSLHKTKSSLDFQVGKFEGELKSLETHGFSVPESKPLVDSEIEVTKMEIKPSKPFDFATTIKFKPSQPQDFSVPKVEIEKPSGLYEVPDPNGEPNQPLVGFQSQSELDSSQPHDLLDHKKDHSNDFDFEISNSNIRPTEQQDFSLHKTEPSRDFQPGKTESDFKQYQFYDFFVPERKPAVDSEIGIAKIELKPAKSEDLSSKSKFQPPRPQELSAHKAEIEKPFGLYEFPNPNGELNQPLGEFQSQGESKTELSKGNGFGISNSNVRPIGQEDFSSHKTEPLGDFQSEKIEDELNSFEVHDFSVPERNPSVDSDIGRTRTELKPSKLHDFSTTSKFKLSQTQDFSVPKAEIEKPSGLYEIPVPNGEPNQPLGVFQSQSKLESSQFHGFSGNENEHSKGFGFGISDSNIRPDGQQDFNFHKTKPSEDFQFGKSESELKSFEVYDFSNPKKKPLVDSEIGVNETELKPSEPHLTTNKNEFKPYEHQNFLTITTKPEQLSEVSDSIHIIEPVIPSGLYELPTPKDELEQSSESSEHQNFFTSTTKPEQLSEVSDSIHIIEPVLPSGLYELPTLKDELEQSSESSELAANETELKHIESSNFLDDKTRPEDSSVSSELADTENELEPSEPFDFSLQKIEPEQPSGLYELPSPSEIVPRPEVPSESAEDPTFAVKQTPAPTLPPKNGIDLSLEQRTSSAALIPKSIKPERTQSLSGMPYDFSWGVNAPNSGNLFSQKATSDGKVTEGQYSILLPDGRIQVVRYRDDGHSGFVAKVTYITPR